MSEIRDFFDLVDSDDGWSIFRDDEPRRGFAHIPSNLESKTSDFVGLLNQGATCYLNSLIQALYMTPEFRAGVYSLVPDDIEDDKNDAEQNAKEQVDQEQKENLMGMGFEESAVIAALLKFKKPEQLEDRINWLLSNNFEEDQSDNSKKKKKRVKKRKLQTIPREMQNLFSLLQRSDQKAISTADLTKSFGWQGREAFEQQDVHELNRVLFDAIEKSLNKTSGKNLLQSLYNGTYVTKTKCTNCKNSSERTEMFQDLAIPVSTFKTLHQSLEAIVGVESLDGDNQYYCDKCEGKVDAHRRVVYRQLPNILILCLGRFEYDKKQQARVKNSSDFEFPMILDMSPYLEEFEDKDPTFNKNFKKGDLLVGEFNPESSNVYDLSVVVIHVGSNAGFGHYHAYIRDVASEGKHQESVESEIKDEFGYWYDFNDESVTPIATEKITKQYGGKDECAYMLVYRQRTNKPSVDVQLPQKLLEIVEEHNKKINEEKNRIKEESYKFEIDVVCEDHYAIENDQLKEKSKVEIEDTNSDDELVDLVDILSESVPENMIKKSNLNENRTQKTLTIDKRDKVTSLMDLISSTYPKGPASSEIQLDQVFDEQGIVHILKTIVTPESFDESLTIDDLNLKHKGKYLVWNGKKIGNKDYTPNSHKVKFNAIYTNRSAIPPTTTSFDLETLESSTLLDIRNHLSSLTGLPVPEQNLGRLRNKRTIPFTSNEDKLNLYELNIGKFSTLTLEKLMPNVNGNIDFEYEEEEKQDGNPNVTLNIINNCQVPEQTDQLQVEKDITLKELKIRLISKLNLDIKEDNLALRRYSDGYPGSIFTNEKLILRRVDLDVDGCTCIIERRDSPTPQGLALKFNLEKSEDKSINLISSDSWTVRQLKHELSKMIDCEPEKFRLRTTDYWGNPQKLITDEDKTLTNCKIRYGDTLFIEMGAAPVKGQITVNFELYTLKPPSEQQDNQHQDLYSPLLHLSSFSKSNDFTNFSIVPLNDFVEISFHSNLLSLKEALHTKSFSHLPSCQYLRLWHKTRPLKQDKVALKRQFVSCDCRLTIQVLDAEDELLLNNGNRSLTYVHKRKKDRTGFEPPVSYYFEGFTTDELASDLSINFDIPIESLMIARYEMYKAVWEVLFDGSIKETNQNELNDNKSEVTESLNQTQESNNNQEKNEKESIVSITNEPPKVENQETINSQNMNNSQDNTQQNSQTNTTQNNNDQKMNEKESIVSITNEPPKVENQETINTQNTDNSQQNTQIDTTQNNTETQQKNLQTDDGKKRRRVRRQRRQALLVDGTLLAIKDLRDDPEGSEDNFAVVRERQVTKNVYERSSTALSKRKEVGLTIRVTEEEYEYVEYTDSEEESDEQL